MFNFTVLYRVPEMASTDPPRAYHIVAEDMDTAEGSCEWAHPHAEIVWTHEGTSASEAMAAYQSTIEEESTPTIYVEVRNGVVQSVYGDDVTIEIVVRDLDNIDAGDDDPLPDDYEPERYYW